MPSIGVLHARIKAKKDIEVCVVHFSPNRLFSKLHLEETLNFLKENQLDPIILGDFNIDDHDIIKILASENYSIATHFNHCITLPNTKRTIDDILIPQKYKFKSFFCDETNLSDHRALIAEITFNSDE